MRSYWNSMFYRPVVCGLFLIAAIDTAACGTLLTGETAGGDADVYGDYVVDLGGLAAHGLAGSAMNPVLNLSGTQGEGSIQEHVRLAGVRWDVEMATVGGAWLSDLRLGLTLRAGMIDEHQILIGPAFGDDFGGSGSYASSGWIDLVALGLDGLVGGDNTIRVEVFGVFDDSLGADVVFLEGSTVTLGLQVPGAGGAGVLMFGMAWCSRRRRG